MGTSFASIDPAALPDHFDAQSAEKRLTDAWEREGIYRFDPSQARENTFSVDTPPPAVSGSLHIGHVFSSILAPASNCMLFSAVAESSIESSFH